MNATKMIGAIATPVLLMGCSHMNIVSAPTPNWPWDSTTSVCSASSCTPNEALSAYLRANSFCRDVQNYYESGGQRANNTKLAVGVVGTLAGAVIAPVAKGTAATAWSGLSGATNGVQVAFDEAFSSSLAVNRRVAVVAAAVEGDENYQSKATDNERVVAAISMATACANASALADQKALQSLSSTPETQKSLKSKITASSPASKATQQSTTPQELPKEATPEKAKETKEPTTK